MGHWPSRTKPLLIQDIEGKKTDGSHLQEGKKLYRNQNVSASWTWTSSTELWDNKYLFKPSNLWDFIMAVEENSGFPVKDLTKGYNNKGSVELSLFFKAWAIKLISKEMTFDFIYTKLKLNFPYYLSHLTPSKSIIILGVNVGTGWLPRIYSTDSPFFTT